MANLLYNDEKTRVCNKCNKRKNISKFHILNLNRYKKAGKLYRRRICKECFNSRSKNYHNPIRKRKTKQARIIRFRRRIWEYFIKHPCVNCGENDPLMLEFDHVNNKIASVSSLIGQAYSWNKIKIEIGKCQVLCHRCHKIKTAKEQGWYGNKLPVWME